MTNEEIAEATRKFNVGEIGHWEAAGFLSHTLDALEEANREIAQLKAHVCSLRCADEAKSEDHEPGCPFFTGTYA